MPEYKNQHTVPKFYLRRFSKNGKNINIWIVSKKQKILGKAEIKNECREAYFYSREPKFEKKLGLLDTLASNALQEIDSKLDLPLLGSKEHEDLAAFTIMQYARTAGWSRIWRETAEKVQARINEKSVLEKISKAPAEIFPGPKHEQNQLSMVTILKSRQTILDMNYRLLLNESKTDFLTSDMPVVFYNQLLLDGKYVSHNGMKVRGFEIFFPIDSKKLVLFFDPNAYSIGKKGIKTVHIEDEKDVNEINKLQICSAEEKIYFEEENLNIEQIHEAGIRYRKTRGPKEFESTGSYIPIEINAIEVNLHLSFVKIRRHAEIWRDNQFKKINDEITVLQEELLRYDGPDDDNRLGERLIELQRQTYR